MTTLTIGADTFRVEVTGDPTRPALMLSNSLGADLSMWDGQMAPLTERFRVIRYDARGHGGSRSHDTTVSIADLGRDALAILDALEIERVHWIGLSMGGSVGLWLLAHAPDRIGRAVLANTAPKVGTPASWNTRIAAVRADGMDETAAALMERWFSPAFTKREPTSVAKIHELVRHTSPQAYAACCAALRDMDLRETLHGIANEVLVITGADDPVVPSAEAEVFIAAIPGARHVALAARHLSNVEAEADFNAAIVDFLTAKATARPKRLPASRPEPAKTVAVKRGGAARRSNAARAPLKTPAKKTTAKKTTVKAAAGATKKKPAAGHRRPSAAVPKTRRAAPKAVAKKRAAKTPRKTSTTRRRTPVTAARGPAKTPVRKAKAKTVAKAAKKVARKTSTRKPPTGRRKTTIKPRRPTGRRKR